MTQLLLPDHKEKAIILAPSTIPTILCATTGNKLHWSLIMEDTGHTGFTLLELLVTLALVGSLTGLAVPAMGRFLDTARLRSATEAFSQELQQARNHALTHQQSVYFSLSVAADRWCYGWSELAACDCNTGDSEATACRTGSDSQQRVHRRLSTDFPSVELNTTRPAALRTLHFSPLRGTASADSFALHNGTGELRVIVSPLGRVRICSTDGRGYGAC
ncbi:MAG: GspH/FimT family pseudopilin [Pseudomonadota bacterium]|nr:GspH/FimT family pseudopilin [Pseudomonadota bacterium]